MKILYTKHFFTTAILTFLLAMLSMGTVQSQTWKLIQPLYPTTGTFVAGFSVADYGATGDGTTDVTSIFQARLNALGALGGGSLFVPAGKYVLKGNLNIPKGITIRGEWEKPIKGQAIKGTILMVYTGRGNENATPFITMEPSSAVMDLSIWYPEQDAGNITAYAPSIMFGKPQYFGNDFCNVKNVTLVNSYSGIVYSRTNGGGCQTINGLYGTPLSRGIEIDNVADVGRLENIDFSPDYWAGSGLSGSPVAGSAYAAWISQNGTAIVMRRNDWTNTSYVNVEGYNIGFHAAPSIASAGTTPNGQNYDMTFTKCRTGIYIENAATVGIMFSKINIMDCNTGVKVGALTSGAVQFHTSTIDASDLAITAEDGSTARLLLQHCTIAKGKVAIAGSTFNASDCDFNNAVPQILIEKDSRAVLSGNRFKNSRQIKNTSIFVSTIDHTPLNLSPLPDFPKIVPETHKPAKQVMYLATAAPYNAKADGVTDNTLAIQSALNAAAADGGGVVFLPPGKYKVLGNLSVPQGVELKGSTDVSTVPTGPGSVLEVYAGRGSATGTPFLKLSAGSGIRGLTFNYPEQMASALPAIPAYPYCIQATGSNVYIINIAIRAVYNGIDLFSYKCDNHFVDYYCGHAFNNAIKVGGGSTGGKILNMQFNTFVYAVGKESKMGSWPNSPTGDNTAAYDYGYDNLKFLILGDCKNQLLYNDFIFGANKGLILAADNATGPSGLSLGTGIDGTRNSLNIDAVGTGGFDFINSQIVAFGDTTTRYVTTDIGFNSRVTFYNSDFWGNAGRNLIVNGGTLDFQTTNFKQPGQVEFAAVKPGAKLNIENSAIWPGKLTSNGSERRMGIRSSVVDSTGISTKNTALWFNNIGNAWSVVINGDLDRRAWTATASVNNNNAKNALDSVANTRWDSQGPQQAGQYFIVDMKTLNTVDKILLDASASPNDSPMGYQVFLSTDGTNWGTAVASGIGGGAFTIINLSSLKGRYIKILQTGTKSNYWSIHEFRVFGKIDVTGVTITPATFTLTGNETKQFTSAITPENATNKKLSWVSSNMGIATVDGNGLVTGVASGQVTITVVTEDNAKESSSTVTVNSVNVTGLSIVSTADVIKLKSTRQLTVSVTPENASNKNVIWSSSDPTVATVNTNGLVTAIAEGTVNITAKSVDGGKIASVTMRVIHNDTENAVVYPNPLTGSTIHIRLPQQQTGNFTAKFINLLGQSLQTAVVKMDNGTGEFILNQKYIPGIYQLEIINKEIGYHIVKKIVLVDQ